MTSSEPPDPDRWRRQRWEKDTRYYEAYLQQDLWGQWILTRVWGRCGTLLGQVRNLPCASYADGLDQLARLDKRRRQRGYVGADGQ